ncbi:hypothetical protein CONCODRAFT_9509 [Conidiobolus coronatus NRRL 28638]|uniref:Uncharacterized protein n=1 Tax=Conidiobolus coronatus (strain ATCC 28846 / CBS 209.66 / NRRL 28638) TaxID=796925 RepID=A0A137P089_CONC2|nr:hypothetical protein CONCODRAFT_9509 [Conidiobolus coronatus NRRL 28638]|eukprot:KXN68279.1 hypothetical protein CONCODRAFT_9509 [Conidiobolus coronatus NRRL 28638]
MSHLEHVEIVLDGLPGKIINIQKPNIPKSLKSLNINLLGHFTMYEDDKLYPYDTIDPTYINLHTLTIISNRLLQNLSTGIPNLQNVKIKIMELDESKFIKFLKANPQLRNLETILEEYNEEIINTVLSSKHLKQWSIDSWIREDEEVRCHSTNYSIKYLRIFIELPDLTVFNIIDACKGLEILDYKREDFELTLSLLLKLKRKIDIKIIF